MSATSEICMHKFMPQASDEYANTKAKRLTGSFISVQIIMDIISTWTGENMGGVMPLNHSMPFMVLNT